MLPVIGILVSRMPNSPALAISKFTNVRPAMDGKTMAVEPYLAAA
jgi:hypothetical protein